VTCDKSRKNQSGCFYLSRHSSLVTRHFVSRLANKSHSHYSQCLKAIPAAFSIASAILLVACVVFAAGCAEDGPTTQEVGDQLQRGVTGKGQLGDINRADDPYVKPRGQ
jgi:hypothetical protein